MAGLLFAGSTGSIEGVHSSSLNRFGLVIQDEPRPALGKGNSLDGNREQRKIVGGDLPVPTAISALP